ncbi:hypothetical protein D0466_19690 [Peribacillus glennii]|uniref:Uncharacterized protein n=1 Tax=Peribacillus glennii TaxID=2303991 RepID=A0A372L771_9BACI|nr:hypothetical protein D0466_19690 [Peribacillus glennii]
MFAIPPQNKSALDYLPEETVKDTRFYPTPEMTEKLEVYETLARKIWRIITNFFLNLKCIRNK